MHRTHLNQKLGIYHWLQTDKETVNDMLSRWGTSCWVALSDVTGDLNALCSIPEAFQWHRCTVIFACVLTFRFEMDVIRLALPALHCILHVGRQWGVVITPGWVLSANCSIAWRRQRLVGLLDHKISSLSDIIKASYTMLCHAVISIDLTDDCCCLCQPGRHITYKSKVLPRLLIFFSVAHSQTLAYAVIPWIQG